MASSLEGWFRQRHNGSGGFSVLLANQEAVLKKSWTAGIGNRSRLRKLAKSVIASNRRMWRPGVGRKVYNLTTDFGANSLVADADINGVGTSDTARLDAIIAAIPDGCDLYMPPGRYAAVTGCVAFYRNDVNLITSPFATSPSGQGFINNNASTQNNFYEHCLFLFNSASGNNWRAQNAWYLATRLTDGSADLKAGDQGFRISDGGYARMVIGMRLNICSGKHGYSAGNLQTNPKRAWCADVVALGPNNTVYISPALPFDVEGGLIPAEDGGLYGLFSATSPGAQVTGCAVAPVTEITMDATMKTGIRSVLNNEWHAANVNVYGLLLKSTSGQVGLQLARDAQIKHCVISSGRTGPYMNRAQGTTIEDCKIRTGNNMHEFGICSNFNIMRNIHWYWNGDPSYGAHTDPWLIIGDGEFSCYNLYEHIWGHASGWNKPTASGGFVYMIRSMGDHNTYRDIHCRVYRGNAMRLIHNIGTVADTAETGGYNVYEGISMWMNTTTPPTEQQRPFYIGGPNSILRSCLYAMPPGTVWTSIGERSLCYVSGMLIEDCAAADPTHGAGWLWNSQGGGVLRRWGSPASSVSNGVGAALDVTDCAPSSPRFFTTGNKPPWSIPGFYTLGS